MEIEVPEDDYFYRKYHVRCQDFVRAFPGVQPKCRLGTYNILTFKKEPRDGPFTMQVEYEIVV